MSHRTRIDRRGLVRHARRLLYGSVALLLLGLAILGHAVMLLIGAADALVTAWLGVPRLAYGTRRFVEVVRDTWKDER